MTETAAEHGISSYLPHEGPRKGLAFCMSGGGDRAALFHLGALRRMNELGILSKIDTFTSVSGGSIMAAQLATFMQSATREPGTSIEGFEEGVAKPMRRFAAADPRTGAALARLKPNKWFTPGAQSEALAAAYAEGPAPGRLEDLPDTPRFVFLASDMRFRDQWVFDTGKRRVGSSAAGYGPLGTWTLAQAVASSCVPGAFSVVKAKQEPSSLTGGSYTERDRDKLVREIDLSDGGMFDNLGVEPVWQDHQTVLVSDAAPSFKPEPKIGWLWSALRQGVILLEQATEVRKRWLVSNFLAGQLQGAYWGISSKPRSYRLEAEHTAYSENLIRDYIAPIRIDLDVFSEGEIAVLENHGYLMAEIALQRHARDLGGEKWPKAVAPHEDWLNENKAEKALTGSDKTHMFFRPRIHP